MELTAIITALVVAVCAVVVLTGLALKGWVAGRPALAGAITRLADRLTQRLDQLRPPKNDGQGPSASTLLLKLVLGLTAVRTDRSGGGNVGQ